MPLRLKKGLKWLALGTFMAVAASCAAALALAYGSLPPLKGEYRVACLNGRVEIRFDARQRPYVQAQTLEDALFAEGWLHGTHRLWQMELFRRAAKGRLAELLGPSMLDTDKELWRMGIPQLGCNLEAKASSQMQRYVAHYVSGVNAAITRAAAPPPEFLLLRWRPEPWTARDVHSLAALMALQSANNAKNELLRFAIFEELGMERAALFLPDDGNLPEFPYVMPRRNENHAASAIRALKERSVLDPLEKAFMPRFAFGSNAWAVAPKRSKSGNALFAFDSHDELGLPNLFYEVHLFFGENRQISGWSVAGLPGVVNGYNERIAWGFTNIGDTQDLFIETRSERNPLQFKDGDEWYFAEVEIVEIPVRGREDPESFEIVHTRNGPLIADNPPLALRWTVQDLNEMSMEGLLSFNLARNWEEFTKALDSFPAPTLNAIYADVDGNIGFRTAGQLPLRGQGEGLFPLPGDDPANRWQGIVPPAQLPQRQNPESGFLAAANARVNAAGEGPLVSADNAPGYRIRRIQSVLSSREDHAPEDMQALQMDWRDQQAALLLPTLLATLAKADLTALEQRARKSLDAWQQDFLALPERSAPLIFQAWYRHIAKAVFKGAMSEDLFAQLYKNNYPLNHALDRLLLREPDSAWWRGERDAIAILAFKEAVEEIRAAQGDAFEHWRLDRMHRVELKHELGKAAAALAPLFNAPSAPWGGAATTVGRARYRYDRAYDVTSAATLRVVGEMKPSGPEMRAVIPGGQSGHPLSPCCHDQFQSWLAGDLLPIAAGPQDVPGPTLTLLPENANSAAQP